MLFDPRLHKLRENLTVLILPMPKTTTTTTTITTTTKLEPVPRGKISQNDNYCINIRVL
jgi:hypothetical protein